MTRSGVSPDNEREEIINLDHVWVQYDSVSALEDISLTVFKRDFLGIIGPNGGGKSTLLKVLLGLVKPSNGKAAVFGSRPGKMSHKIGYVAQYHRFDRDFPINVWSVVLMGRLGYSALLRGYSANDRQAARDALERVGMGEYKKRHISELSGGQQQRVMVARALATNPEILLLDEPMSSVDTSVQKGFYELLEDLNKQMAIIMVSHDITAVSLYVKKIACLNRRLYYHDSKELTAEDLHSAYECPVQLIAHGVPHRVLKDHTH